MYFFPFNQYIPYYELVISKYMTVTINLCFEVNIVAHIITMHDHVEKYSAMMGQAR